MKSTNGVLPMTSHAAAVKNRLHADRPGHRAPAASDEERDSQDPGVDLAHRREPECEASPPRASPVERDHRQDAQRERGDLKVADLKCEPRRRRHPHDRHEQQHQQAACATDPPGENDHGGHQHDALDREPGLPRREEAESGRHGRARQDQECWRVMIQVDLEGPDEARLDLAGALQVGILRDVEDVRPRRGEARGFGVRAQAAVGAKERAVRQDREVRARVVEHEVAKAYCGYRRSAEHGHDGDDGRPIEALVSDGSRLQCGPPENDDSRARHERARDLPRHARRREADHERWPGQAGCEHEYERDHRDRE